MLTRQAIARVAQHHGVEAPATWLIRAVIGLTVVVICLALGGWVSIQLVVLSAITLAAASLCRLAAISADGARERTGWNWFGVSMLFYTLYFSSSYPDGEMLVGEISLFGGLTRVFTLLTYLSCLVGLLYAVRVPRAFLTRLLLDTMVVLFGSAVIMAEILRNTSMEITATDLGTRLLYRPLADVAILTLMGVTVASMPRTARMYPSLARGMLALTCLFIGHLGASLAILQGETSPPAWVYIFYGFTGLMIAAAAYRYILDRKTGEQYVPASLVAHNPVTHSFWFHLGNAVIPYTIAMSAATLLFIRALRSDASDFATQFTLFGALAFVAVGGVRHILSHAENRNLYRHMSELNRDLEILVERRTEELTHRNEELEAVHQVAMVSAISLDLRVILQAVAEQLSHAMGASLCTIYEDSGNTTRMIARFDRNGPPTTAQLRDPTLNLLKLPGGVFHEVGSRSSVIKRWEQPPGSDAADILDQHGSLIAMVVPLLAGDQTVGFAELYRSRVDAFSSEEISLAEAVTTQAALATENARAYSRARFAANHDPVTGLLNHRALHEEMRRLFNRAMLTGSPMTVVMMDLNLFKEFNDQFGHQAGDRVLSQIAATIKQSVPTTAITARYGGDEFTVVVPDCPPESALIFISSIRDGVGRIQDQHGFVGEGFGIAVGVASFPADGASLSSIVAQADDRMYDDKRRLKGFVERRRSPGSLDSSPDEKTSAAMNLKL